MESGVSDKGCRMGCPLAELVGERWREVERRQKRRRDGGPGP